MQNELVAALYKENLFSELLEEGPQVATRRQQCSTLLDVLKRAHSILNEVRDFDLVDAPAGQGARGYGGGGGGMESSFRF